VDWQGWLKGLDSRRVKKKRRPGGGKLKPLGEAPGEYVKARG
jgi:poly(3-hydroxyalkanoate) synthetase